MYSRTTGMSFPGRRGKEIPISCSPYRTVSVNAITNRRSNSSGHARSKECQEEGGNKPDTRSWCLCPKITSPMEDGTGGKNNEREIKMNSQNCKLGPASFPFVAGARLKVDDLIDREKKNKKKQNRHCKWFTTQTRMETENDPSRSGRCHIPLAYCYTPPPRTLYVLFTSSDLTILSLQPAYGHYPLS